jgi:hypothetical protein
MVNRRGYVYAESRFGHRERRGCRCSVSKLRARDAVQRAWESLYSPLCSEPELKSEERLADKQLYLCSKQVRLESNQSCRAAH